MEDLHYLHKALSSNNDSKEGLQSVFNNELTLLLPFDGVDLKQFLDSVESSLILQAMIRSKGNKNKAAKLLKLNRTTLIEKIKKKNLIFFNY